MTDVCLVNPTPRFLTGLGRRNIYFVPIFLLIKSQLMFWTNQSLTKSWVSSGGGGAGYTVTNPDQSFFIQLQMFSIECAPGDCGRHSVLRLLLFSNHTKTAIGLWQRAFILLEQKYGVADP